MTIQTTINQKQFNEIVKLALKAKQAERQYGSRENQAVLAHTNQAVVEYNFASKLVGVIEQTIEERNTQHQAEQPKYMDVATKLVEEKASAMEQLKDAAPKTIKQVSESFDHKMRSNNLGQKLHEDKFQDDIKDLKMQLSAANKVQEAKFKVLSDEKVGYSSDNVDTAIDAFKAATTAAFINVNPEQESAAESVAKYAYDQFKGVDANSGITALNSVLSTKFQYVPATSGLFQPAQMSAKRPPADQSELATSEIATFKMGAF